MNETVKQPGISPIRLLIPAAAAAAFVFSLVATPSHLLAISRKACRRKGCKFNARLWKCICATRLPRKRGCMLKIPAGCYMRGTLGGSKKETPVHRVCLSAFKINRYEVTVNEYTKCVQARVCTKPTSYAYRRHTRYCNYGASGKGDHPVNCLNWKQANAYCKWKNQRLPTEAEWEYAARGKDGRLFPWGNSLPTCARAVVMDKGTGACKFSGTRRVGSKPKGASPFGVMDMAGNVAEWTADNYSRTAYTICRSGCTDPIVPMWGLPRYAVIRGGSWTAQPRLLRSNRRWYAQLTARGAYLGFRCAWSKHKPMHPSMRKRRRSPRKTSRTRR
jgi:formylglycine-generating enzyme required for sulfatase activity